MIRRRFRTGLDPVLLALVLALSLMGGVGVYSAAEPGSSGLFVRQLIWVALGIGVCAVLISLDYRLYTDYAPIWYCGALALLVLVLIYGSEINGSRSWLVLGPVQIQPSELGKLAVLLTLAKSLAGLNRRHPGAWRLLKVGFLTLVPMVLVVLQGDLGTALMYVPIMLGIIIVAGLRVRILVWCLLAVLCASPAVWIYLKDYQKQRILTTLDPELDPQGVGYQTRQSQIAIGSGGVFGRGIGHGSQSHFGFVPEIHSDFIFALLAEETGLIGAGTVLLLYLLVLMRLIRIAVAASDRTVILVVTGVVSMISSHILVNVGMTLGLLPPIGIPLPLLSYGGSFTLVTFAALGVALSAQSQSYVN